MKTIAEYEQTSGLTCQLEEFTCLQKTRLVFSDTQRFSQDYSNTSPAHTAKQDEEASGVLLRAGSIISRPHTLSNPVHKPLSGTAAFVGYRPPNYGRAAIIDLSNVGPDTHRIGFREGLLEVKGCGIANGMIPDLDETKNGVLFMHQAFIELINYVLLNRLFNQDGMGISTIPFYAIIDTGIRANVKWAKHGLPCATLLRKTVVRPPDNIEIAASGSKEEAIKHRIECYLLSRGLTTTGPVTTVTIVREGSSFVARVDGKVITKWTEEVIFLLLRSLGLHPPQIFHFANVQIARESSLEPLQACLIDLGHIRACDDLPGHLVIAVRDRPGNLGITTKKGSPNWPSRSTQRSIDQSVFGPQLVFQHGMDDEIFKWLQPTDSFQKVSSGVLCEAIRLTMLVDRGNYPPQQLMNDVIEFVDRICPIA